MANEKPMASKHIYILTGIQKSYNDKNVDI